LYVDDYKSAVAHRDLLGRNDRVGAFYVRSLVVLGSSWTRTDHYQFVALPDRPTDDAVELKRIPLTDPPTAARSRSCRCPHMFGDQRNRTAGVDPLP
jgi:hypothetical protein